LLQDEKEVENVDIKRDEAGSCKDSVTNRIKAKNIMNTMKET
jgi:hypothetical protein